MRLEIRSASLFLSDLLRLSHSLTDQQLQMFRVALEELLRIHYLHHWFPEHPTKGSGYRCIRINHKMDPMIAKAAQSSGVGDSSLLRNLFPNELTLWIDPREVSYRIGENGSICVLYDAEEALQNCSNRNNNSLSSTSTSNTTNSLDRYSTCKESVRGMDHFIMDRRNMNLDQFAPYVSS